MKGSITQTESLVCPCTQKWTKLTCGTSSDVTVGYVSEYFVEKQHTMNTRSVKNNTISKQVNIEKSCHNEDENY